MNREDITSSSALSTKSKMAPWPEHHQEPVAPDKNDDESQRVDNNETSAESNLGVNQSNDIVQTNFVNIDNSDISVSFTGQSAAAAAAAAATTNITNNAIVTTNLIAENKQVRENYYFFFFRCLFVWLFFISFVSCLEIYHRLYNSHLWTFITSFRLVLVRSFDRFYNQ